MLPEDRCGECEPVSSQNQATEPRPPETVEELFRDYDRDDIRNRTVAIDILTQLRAEDADGPWCGPGGLFQRAADEIERLRSELELAKADIAMFIEKESSANA